jgi:hypothetical protein
MPKAKYVFELVFPPESYAITFLESPNGIVDKEALRNRVLSEEIILEFYKQKMSSYGIVPGNMEAIKKYMFNHNPSFTGERDKLHQEMTEKIQSTIQGKDPLY